MHSSRYLAAKAERERKMSDLRVQREAEETNNAACHLNGNGAAGFFDGEERDTDGRIKPQPGRTDENKAMLEKQAQLMTRKMASQIEALKKHALLKLIDQLDKGTDDFYKQRYGTNWRDYKAFDEAQQQHRKQQWQLEAKQDEERKRSSLYAAEAETVPIVDGGLWPGNGVFKDDYDARY